MTRREWLWELDRLAAEKVMGYDLAEHSEHAWTESVVGKRWCERCFLLDVGEGEVEDGEICRHIPRAYSDEIWAAWQLVEQLRGGEDPNMFHVIDIITCEAPGKYLATVTRLYAPMRTMFSGHMLTPPH